MKSDRLLKRHDINYFLDQLDERMRDIVRSYYGLNGGGTYTLQSLGDKYGVTRERIRQLRNKGLNRLRKMIEEEVEPVMEFDREEDKLVVKAVECNKCGDVVYSRARHDFRSCSCGHVSVDGGFDYFKVVGNEHDFNIITVELYGVTVHDLYEDWNNERDEYGWKKATHLPYDYECTECGAEALFYGRTKYEADKEAKEVGWDLSKGKTNGKAWSVEMCPDCSRKE